MKLNSKYIPAAILIQSFFLLTTSFISKASAENCQYSVNKDNGKQYNMSDFVKNEIRPEIQQSKRLFNVNTIRSCDNFANEKF